MPYEPCLTCFRGDTSTAFGYRGTATAVAAALNTMLGFTIEEAMALVEECIEESNRHSSGIDGGRRIGGAKSRGVHEWKFRLCRDCARRANITVGEASGKDVPGYDLTAFTEGES